MSDGTTYRLRPAGLQRVAPFRSWSRWVGWLAALIVGSLVLLPGPAVADGEPTGTPARWVGVGRAPLPHALKLGGRTYAAGLNYYRIGENDTVPAYSLSVRGAIDRSATLHAIPADRSGVSNLEQVTFLAKTSSDETAEARKRGRLVDLKDLAAFQLAIWHFTDRVPLTHRTVPEGRILNRAQQLIRTANRWLERNKGYCQAGDAHCQPTLSTDATAPTMNLLTGDSTVGEHVLRVTLTVGGEENTLNVYQKVDVRLNGIWTTVCTTEEDEILTGERPTNNPLESTCARQAKEWQDNNAVPGRTEYPRYRVKQVGSNPILSEDTGLALVRVPRLNRKQQIEFVWPFDEDPGVVYFPSNSSQPIITAGQVHLAPTLTVIIDPSDFSELQATLQRYTVAFITPFGIIGLLVFALMIGLLLNFKEFVALIFRGVFYWPRRWMRKSVRRFLRWRRARKRRTTPPPAPGQAGPGPPAADPTPPGETDTATPVSDRLPPPAASPSAPPRADPRT